LISHKYKFIFFHVPKAAGSSIIRSYKKHLGPDVIINDQNKRIKKWLKRNSNVLWPNHTSPRIMKKYLDYETRFLPYYKFAFVRHPYDRIISLYHYTIQKEEAIYKSNNVKIPEFTRNILEAGSFENWILSKNIGTSQYNFLSSANGKLLVDFVGHTENITEDLNLINNKLNLGKITIENVNKSDHQSAKKYITPILERIIYENYADDFKHFNYDRYLSK